MGHSEKLIFVNFAGDVFFTEVIKKIQSHYPYDIIIISSKSTNDIELECNVELIDSSLLQREETVCNAFAKYSAVNLTGDLLKSFYECKSYFAKTLDRVFLTPIPVRKQETYFNELLSHALSFFSKNKNTKAVIFDASPHFPWDVVIFFVARFIGIETRILRRTLLDDRVVFDCDFRKNSGRIVRYETRESFLGNSKAVVKRDESFWLNRSKSLNHRLKNSIFSSLPMEFLTSFPWLIVFFFQSYKKYRTGYIQLVPLQFFWRLILQKIRVLALRRWLLSNFDAVNLHEPFVYFALHFQPERSTDPEAEEFSHQYLAIRLLADSLPKGWKIYVKEHPRQISPHPDVRMTHYRSVQDYVKIQSISNVSLVHPEYDSEELIRHCRMTATCTGSTVWEGMLKGRPGITFGRVWHEGCRSSITVSNATDCAMAVDVLSKKSESEVLTDVDDFLTEFQTCMIVSANSDISASASSIPRDILVSNLAEAIVKSLP